MHSRSFRLSLFAGAALGLAACGPSGTPQLPAPADPARGVAGQQWMANLQPVGTSTVSGTANVSAGDGNQQTRVTINIAGADPGTILPWHIHRGQCGSNQGIHGDPRAYPGISAGQQGTAELHVVLPIEPPAGGNFMINVHRSPSDMRTIVACGNLIR